MKALIIAAGQGSRLNGRHSKGHKTLVSIWGMTVIERILAALPMVDELVVVTGHEARILEQELRALIGGKVGLRFVFNPQYERPNGISVLAAREALADQENFLLCMSDHVFEPVLVERLCAEPPRAGECLLAVDRSLGEIFDLEDATKVSLDERTGKIVEIGKHLESYNALDTGVFFCTPVIFEALAEAASSGKESLSDGVRVLCGRSAMGYRDVSGATWEDIDTQESLAMARKKFLRLAVRGRDGVVSKLFNRKVSGLITRLVCPFRIHPNQVTVINLLLALAASWLMATGYLLAGGITAQLYSIVDGVDGEIARLKHQSSYFGGWLDSILDRLCDWALICGASAAVWSTGSSYETGWMLMALALISNISFRTSMDSLLVSGVLREPRKPSGLLARVEAWFYERDMVFGLTHDVYLLILALGVALEKPAATLGVLIALETLFWTAKLLQVRKAAPSKAYENLLKQISAWTDF